MWLRGSVNLMIASGFLEGNRDLQTLFCHTIVGILRSDWDAQILGAVIKQGMLFSIVPRFGNTWVLLCLAWLDADWLNGCVCLESLHSDCFCCMWYLLCLEILQSDCFCCMWYCYHAFSLDECPSSPAGGRIFCCPCILIGWVIWRRKRHPLLKWPQIVL